jgi:hypothetical protein
MAVSPYMTMRNKYVRRSHITEKKFRQLVKLFSLDLDAIQISELSHLNRNTVNRYLKIIRTRIAELCEIESKSCTHRKLCRSFQHLTSGRTFPRL